MKKIIIFIISAILILNPIKVYAFDNNYFYNTNDIIYYDENAQICGNTSSTGVTASGAGYDRLKEAVKSYAEKAMEMQKTYGTPWEVVFAQMQHESQTGTAGIAVSGADNNWLGITGEGDAGSWTSQSGRKWAKYSDVSASIQDWAGPRVLRNGAYNDAFQYLDPNNYNLEEFLRVMISHYAPSSDGNNEQSYVSSVMALINGPIKEVREENGWKSSAELAKSENIAIGGSNSLDSDLSNSINDPGSAVYGGCTGGTASADATWPSNVASDNNGWSIKDDTDYSAIPCANGTSDNSIYTHPIKKFSIRLCDVSNLPGAVVSSLISAKIYGLVNDAKAAGITVSSTGGWRSYEDQQDLRRKNCANPETTPSSQCDPPTAVAGNSEHEKGLAIDFGNMRSSDPQSNFSWFEKDASKYGFYNLPSEYWHWSMSGS